jgi:hypothetical protein
MEITETPEFQTAVGAFVRAAEPIAPQRHSLPRLYNTRAASAWFERRGIKLSRAYLRKLRCIGTGPEFHLFNGLPHYTEVGMTKYMEERLSPPWRSNSEAPTPELPTNHRTRPGRPQAAKAPPVAG